MRHIYLSAAVSLLCCSTAAAQSQAEAIPITGVVKNAGILHLATGTWTRNVSDTANLGPDICYANDVASGYFSPLALDIANGDYSLIDEGRIPGPASGVGTADRTDYEINCITFSYCTNQGGPTVGITFNLYESYNPCDTIITAPASPFTLAGTASAAGLPGGPGGVNSCWTVTLDMTDFSAFCLESEGGDQFPGFDSDLSTDSFGIEWVFNGSFGTVTGPILSGDPDWTPNVSGALNWGGTGTYYDNSGMASCGNTGLDTADLVAVDGTNAPIAPGCYFFGGYLNTNGCGGPSNNPFASFNMTLFCDAGECDIVGKDTFCDPAGENSSGTTAEICVFPTTIGAGVRLECTGGPMLPNSGFGFFIVADSTTAGLVVNQGTLCLGQPQGRYNPLAGGDRNSLGQFDANGVFANLAGTSTTGFGFDVPVQLPNPPNGSISSGETWHFQLWYRDINPMPTTNFSNGISITF